MVALSITASRTPSSDPRITGGCTGGHHGEGARTRVRGLRRHRISCSLSCDAPAVHAALTVPALRIRNATGSGGLAREIRLYVAAHSVGAGIRRCGGGNLEDLGRQRLTSRLQRRADAVFAQVAGALGVEDAGGALAVDAKTGNTLLVRAAAVGHALTVDAYGSSAALKIAAALGDNTASVHARADRTTIDSVAADALVIDAQARGALLVGCAALDRCLRNALSIHTLLTGNTLNVVDASLGRGRHGRDRDRSA